MSNQQQTVLVTGATGLLGRQIVRAFEKAGWRTVGTGFSRAGPSSPLKLDLCDAAAVEKVLNDVKYVSRLLRELQIGQGGWEEEY